MVIKPAENTPLTLLRFAQLVAEAEIFPPGVFNVVTGDGVPAGDAIVTNKDVGHRLAHRGELDRQADREERGRHAASASTSSSAARRR